MAQIAGILSATIAGLTLIVSTAHAGSEALDKYAGAKEQIVGYYAANAREGGGNCGPGQMADIGDARVISETGDAVVVAVDYSYSAKSLAGTNACSGTAEREFTLAKGASGYEVTGMTGQMP
jgi:hypothetical protein